MFSLHAIVLPRADDYPLACFGKGQRDEAIVRRRLLPEHDGAVIQLGEPVKTRSELDVRYLILLDQLYQEFDTAKPQWYVMTANVSPTLLMAAAMRSTSANPPELDAAAALVKFREAIEVDGGVLAAMLGTGRTRLHRLEQNEARFTFEDYRRLRVWAIRIGWYSLFNELFSVEVYKNHAIASIGDTPSYPPPPLEEQV